MKEICVGDGGRSTHHLRNLIGTAALIETMSEMSQGRNEIKPVCSKRKSALPIKKSKRKMVQASKKRNR